MNHYESFEEAEKKWYDRLSRVNYRNLVFVGFFSSETEGFKECIRMPCRKIIHTSFDHEWVSGVYRFIDVDYSKPSPDDFYIFHNSSIDETKSVRSFSLVKALLGEKAYRCV